MNNARRILSILASTLIVSACGDNVVDPLSGVAISDLTDAEAQSWCSSTYASMWTGPLPTTDGPVLADGTVWNNAERNVTMATGDNYEVSFADNLCALQLPADQCAANLKVNPCKATLQQLDDCLVLVSGHDQSASPDACATFRAMPSCDQTIVTVPNPPASNDAAGCRLPVR